jgi:putative ABC transport system permease protein
MVMLNKLKLRLRALFFKSKLEEELDEEVRFHLEREIEENIARGMTLEEARYAALRSFGGVERVKEQSRDERGIRFLEEVWQDLRFGARMLLKQPGFTLIAVITLALGIGAVTALFSVVDSVLLRPLPYRDAERLVKVFEVDPKIRMNRRRISLADFYEWKNQSGSFEEMAVMVNISRRVTDVSAPEVIEGNKVSANFFSFLGSHAAMGRVFLPEDEKPDAELVVVLSHQYWATRFGSAPNVIGQKIKLDDKPHVIVGVLREDFRQAFEGIPGRAQIWMPAALTSEALSRRGPGPYVALARLKTGVQVEQARTEMAAIAERLAQAYPASNKGIGAAVYPLHEEVTGGSRQTLLTLLAAVGLVLLIACANVASLLLARSVERSREIAVRSAIGAGRWRIVRQLLTESGLLALVGGAFGLLLTMWMLAGLVPLIPRDVPRTNEITLDYRAMLFTLAVAMLSSLLCGLAPALQTAKVNLSEALKDAARSASASRRNRVWRGSLVVWQVALTMVLLVGAGLLTNSLIRLYRTDPGLDTRNLLAMSIGLPGAKGEVPQQWNVFWKSLADRAHNLPGAQGVALVAPLPLNDSPHMMNVGFPTGAAANSDQPTLVGHYTVSHDYFRLLGVGLRQGRYFTDDDNAGSQPVIIVNESLARGYFPGQEAVGKALILDRGTKDEKAVTIVGVVADSRVRLDRKALPSLYLSMVQFPASSMYMVARTATDPASYFGAMRNLVSSLDRNQPISYLTTMDEIWSNYTVRPRFYLSLFGSLSALALLLAAAGIYGTLSHTVSQRTHEIGVHRALGAQDGDVLRMVVRQGMILAALGVTAGLGAALALTRLMREWLYEVSVADPATFGIATGLLILIALCACYAPARRATKIDPMIALRCE